MKFENIIEGEALYDLLEKDLSLEEKIAASFLNFFINCQISTETIDFISDEFEAYKTRLLSKKCGISDAIEFLLIYPDMDVSFRFEYNKFIIRPQKNEVHFFDYTTLSEGIPQELFYNDINQAKREKVEVKLFFDILDELKIITEKMSLGELRCQGGLTCLVRKYVEMKTLQELYNPQ